MPLLASLTVGDDPAGWREAGFTVDDGECRIGSVRVLLRPEVGKGVRAWALDGDEGEGPIEGVPTDADDVAPPKAVEHANGATHIDHVVLMTPDVDRTVATLKERGFEAKRSRESGTYGAPMTQVFFRMGEVILELVGPQEPTGDGPPRFFGIAVTVDDLDTTAAFLDERLGTVKEAVQPGRRIATLRKSDNVRTAIAFMSS
jgi:catechol 2,3-dioxygenase-like lactoylglutathione lyase family enzyme